MSKAVDAQRKALGKGLSALLPQKHAATPAPSKEQIPAPLPVSQPEPEKPLARAVPIDWIHANPNQPRQGFDEAKISELAQSIRSNGVIQPITVRQTGKNQFMI